MKRISLGCPYGTPTQVIVTITEYGLDEYGELVASVASRMALDWASSNRVMIGNITCRHRIREYLKSGAQDISAL